MIATIEELIKVSGDSYLKTYLYKEGSLTLELWLDELDKLVTLKIETNILALDVPENTDLPYRTCFVESILLEDVLSQNNGIFIPADDFGSFMNEKRNNFNLAYGLRSTDYKFMISLSNSNKLISFVIRELDSIEIIWND